MAVSAVLGLGLQLLALRNLTSDAYATFVFALAVGNIAFAVASSVQPAVAKQAITNRNVTLPNQFYLLAALAGICAILFAWISSHRIGWIAGGLIGSQLLIHPMLGVGFGRLQAIRRFEAIAGAQLVLFSSRLALGALAVSWDAHTELLFLASLPAGLILSAEAVFMMGGFPTAATEQSNSHPALLAEVWYWLGFALLLSADAIIARFALSAEQAGDYALAITLGRQPIYAVGPLTMILLPVTALASVQTQRSRLMAIAAISLALLVVSLLTLARYAPEIISLLTGSQTEDQVRYVRRYVVIGCVSASATLLMTFVFAIRPPVWLAAIGIAATLYLVAGLLTIDSPMALAGAQLGAVVLLTGLLSISALVITRSPADAPT